MAPLGPRAGRRNLQTPKALRPTAQGFRNAATLGTRSIEQTNPNGVVEFVARTDRIWTTMGQGSSHNPVGVAGVSTTALCV